jgi:hypothetical protein
MPAKLPEVRGKSRFHGFHQSNAILPGYPDHFPGFFCIRSQGLFAKDVFPLLHEKNTQSRM